MKKVFGSKIVKNIIFFILLLFLTFWLIFRNQNMNSLIDIVKSAELTYVLMGIFLMLCYHLTEAINIRGMLHRLGERKISVIKALKFTLIGFFFSSITPAATGGQPAEIYFMTKEDISGTKAAMSSLMMLCGFQISTITFGITSAICNPSIFKGGLIWLFILGVIINGVGLSILLIGVFSRRLSEKLVNIIAKILRKIKIKNAEKKIESIKLYFEKFIDCSIYIKTHMSTFIRSVIFGFIQVAFSYSVQYCIYRAFGFNSLNYFELFSMQAVLFTTVSGLPLPGAIGVSETIFLSVYEVAYGQTLKGAMLLSRGVTFYLYVIISLIVVVYNSIRTKKKEEKLDELITDIDNDIDNIKRTNFY